MIKKTSTNEQKLILNWKKQRNHYKNGSTTKKIRRMKGRSEAMGYSLTFLGEKTNVTGEMSDLPIILLASPSTLC